eukprot:scaffold159_cov346-Pinguiococcus_pyrenoidosus.AAC.3
MVLYDPNVFCTLQYIRYSLLGQYTTLSTAKGTPWSRFISGAFQTERLDSCQEQRLRIEMGLGSTGLPHFPALFAQNSRKILSAAISMIAPSMPIRACGTH